MDPCPVGPSLIYNSMLVQKLDLAGNGLSDWQEICKLRRLPKLEQLNLSGNGIASLLAASKDASGSLYRLRAASLV